MLFRSKETVKTFLETRGWKFEVALDADQRVGQNFRRHQLPGSEAARHALHVASDDLLPPGSHGRTGFRRILLGSVTEKVVRHAACSVLAVRGRDEVIELIIMALLADLTERHRTATILITHANPEDNRFARWLAGRLTTSFSW